MIKALIAYASLSGNTQEVAEEISTEAESYGVKTELVDVELNVLPSDFSLYDVIFIGSYTWVNGSTPIEIKEFVSDIGYKPDNVHIFGTGEMQFGDKYYCLTAHKLSEFYDTKSQPLTIEQSPRGNQIKFIKEWTRGVLNIG